MCCCRESDVVTGDFVKRFDCIFEKDFKGVVEQVRPLNPSQLCSIILCLLNKNGLQLQSIARPGMYCISALRSSTHVPQP